MARRIVQLTAATTTLHGHHYETLFAICDDGSCWAIQDWCADRRSKWEKMPSIPESVPNKKYDKQMSFNFDDGVEDEGEALSG